MGKKTIKQMATFLVRQGDVLIQRIDGAMPKLGEPVPRDKGRIVLAYGEVTGHAHAIASREAELFLLAPDNTSDGDAAWRAAQRILTIAGKGATLKHEEHAPIKLPPGNYRVVRQREYSPEELRVVAD